MARLFRPMQTALVTERLVLRQRTPQDAGWNLELKREHAGGTTLTLHQERLRLAQQQATAALRGYGFLTIVRRDDDAPLGYCGLLVGRGSEAEPELAYELLRRYHGNGYATEAANAVMDAAFETGRDRLWSTVREWNAASFRVLEKLGFHRDHVERDPGGDLVYLTRTR